MQVFNIDTFNGFPDVLKVEEVAKMLRIGRNTAYEFVKAGFIRSFMVGRSIRVTKQAVLDYINKGADERL
jgi:excisionase family DNA binding protein